MVKKISVRGSMRNKILLICILCTLIALVLQTTFLLNVSSNMVYEQARDIAYNSLDNMQNELGSYIEGIENNMVNIYNDKAFLGALRDYETVEELRQDYYRYARDYAEKHFTANDGMMALYFYNSAHEIVSVYRKAATPKRNYASDIYEEAEVYNAERVKAYTESAENGMLISSYHNPSTDADMVRFVLKLYDKYKKYDRIYCLRCGCEGDPEDYAEISVGGKYFCLAAARGRQGICFGGRTRRKLCRFL